MLVSSAIQRCRDLLGGDTDNYTKLSGSVNDSVDTLNLEYAALGIGRGTRIELRSNSASEVCYVWAIDNDDDQLTVERGWEGSTAASWSDGTLVAVRPEFTDHEILNAIGEEVATLTAEGIYQKASESLTYDAEEDGYDISGITDMLSPYAVEIVYGGRTHWAYDFKRDNSLLRLLSEHGSLANAATLHYRGVLGSVAGKSTDLSSDVGIPASATDIVPVGAAIRLIENRQARRTQITAQTHARHSEDVGGGDNVRTLQVLMTQRANRLMVERRRLREDWPMRFR